MAEKQENLFLRKARSWATKRKLFGPQAFLKFVILNFVECLNEVTNEFIFKGGNLLWIYIQTPRQTIDLDLATRSIDGVEKIRSLLEKACNLGKPKGIAFKLSKFEVHENKEAASAQINYKTDAGAHNSFDLDIVFAAATDTHEIASPLETGAEYRVATIENIIADKLAASAQFESGNTRMKDFDDLWRISKSEIKIDSKNLAKILKTRKIPIQLDREWLNPIMTQDWKRHAKRYKDLPPKLETIFEEINGWLETVIL